VARRLNTGGPFVVSRLAADAYEPYSSVKLCANPLTPTPKSG